MKTTIVFSLVILFAAGLAGCKSADTQPTNAMDATSAQPSGQSGAEVTQDVSTTMEPSTSTGESDLASIEAAWQSSPHADTFVLDDQGQNNSCARCHAPVNWSPTMEELPESCFACKFELEDPAPLVPENVWANISCNVCHEVDKKGNVQAEYAWLEIAPLEEYAEVASPTELCLKCHAPIDIPAHGSVTVSGAHAGYECTQCHSAHSTAASCDSAGCHGDASIPAHDDYHQSVACIACHDGSGTAVDIEGDTGIWTTYFSPASGESFAFVSHDVSLAVDCSRCHFVDNPWELVDEVSQP